MGQSGHEVPTAGRAVVARVFDEIWNEGRVEVADELFTEGHVAHYGDGTEATVASLIEAVQQQRSVSPQLHYRVEQFLVDGVWVATRWSGTGIGQPDGSSVSRWGMTLWKISDRRIAEAWVLTSEAPPPPPAAVL